MVRWIKHALRVLFTGSSFLLFFTGGTVLAMIILPLVRWLTPGTEEQKAGECRRWVADAWVFFHDYMNFWGLITYRSHHLSAPLPDGPLVVVANHPTLVDVTAIISAWGRLVCVAKPEHFRSPLIGRLLRYCGYIRGGDGGLFAAATVVTNSVEALKGGAAILIFPEGTRSPMNGLRDFRQGAFEMAARAGVPVLPVFITCNPPTLMRGQPWYDVPSRIADMQITLLPLIPPPHRDPAELARRLTEEYRARLQAFLGQRAPDEDARVEPAPSVQVL
ncbi:MAG: 1-acyl-sn-glycerol-3-phosphate acyltransferase [Deltaproteobacteria bacterium]|nr:1-acyl-sn-glycerol-3-phosphate acyltransferase [Deltaproteobacteria bacterium]